MIPQEEYMEKVARMNIKTFMEQGYATAGHNGPHGHKDTPVRNTAHYLIIYSYLYKKYKERDLEKICSVFFSYLKECQQQSKSGAIQCMETDRFDHLNGLIGQGWVIEALIYYYEIFKIKEALDVAKNIFFSQKYDWEQHLWHRIELNGEDIDIDPTSNHQVWFAACSYKLVELCDNREIESMIEDFLLHGEKTILSIYSDGLLRHNLNIKHRFIYKLNKIRYIKVLLTPFKNLNDRKFDFKYIEYGYHIFDLYGLTILKEKYKNFPIFNSSEFKKAVIYASNIKGLCRKNKTHNPLISNVYFHKYNSPAFEWAYVALANGFFEQSSLNSLYESLVDNMYDTSKCDFSRNNPDVETWNARTYEIIKYLDLL